MKKPIMYVYKWRRNGFEWFVMLWMMLCKDEIYLKPRKHVFVAKLQAKRLDFEEHTTASWIVQVSLNLKICLTKVVNPLIFLSSLLSFYHHCMLMCILHEINFRICSAFQYFVIFYASICRCSILHHFLRLNMP